MIAVVTGRIWQKHAKTVGRCYVLLLLPLPVLVLILSVALLLLLLL